MAKKKDNLIDHFEISDDEISVLMDELTRFSPSEAEPLFAETNRVSARS